MPSTRPIPPERAPARNHFFALLPPPRVRDALARLAATLPGRLGGRAEPAHRLHLTLLFLGPLPPGHEAALIAAGDASCGATGPFPVGLERLGRYARSDVVWAGPSAPPDPGLLALHEALRRACVGLRPAASGGRPPARFAPHLTLLRGASRDAIAPADPVGPWRWTADRFVLMRTDPSPGGRVYTRLGEWRLGPVGQA